MEQYRGFIIDTETSDHSVSIKCEEHGVKEMVFGRRQLAILYIDGFADALARNSK